MKMRWNILGLFLFSVPNSCSDVTKLIIDTDMVGWLLGLLFPFTFSHSARTLMWTMLELCVWPTL